VAVGTIDNDTVCDTYGDYTALSTAMEIGGSYSITIVNGDGYSTDQCGVWVDWNQDKDFTDAGEQVTLNGTPGVGPYTGAISPPADAVLGETRMRVRVVYSEAPTPCGVSSYGDVEDYTVVVQELGPPVADFAASSTSVGVGSAVSFTDLSSGLPTAWSWSFEGGSPAASTVQNPTGITYAAVGTYAVTLEVTSDLGSDTETKTGYITVAENALCDATSEECDEYISQVQIGSINNSSDCDYYHDYTALSTDLTIGVGSAITVTNGYGWSDDECGIWVDWNHNNLFTDAGETIAVTGTPGYGPYTATITPPTGAVTGATRMRIRIIYAYSETLDPCGTSSYGEVEDYTLNVE
jgi:PKD repeat protein